MASPGNQHCSSCIGTLSFHIDASQTFCTNRVVDVRNCLPAAVVVLVDPNVAVFKLALAELIDLCTFQCYY